MQSFDQSRHDIAVPPATNLPVAPKHTGAWVQTERKAHEAWARLTLTKPTASALLHHMCGMMGSKNALVIPQTMLAKLLGVSERTVRDALHELARSKWIQIVRLGKGKECAYVVNDQVAWGEARKNIRMSIFSATIVADIEDQTPASIDPMQLHKIPQMYEIESQLPTGPGEEPPSQPSLDGLLPDLPTLKFDDVDPDTGEIKKIGLKLKCRQRPDRSWEGLVMDGKKVVCPALFGASPEDLIMTLQLKGIEVDEWQEA